MGTSVLRVICLGACVFCNTAFAFEPVYVKGKMVNIDVRPPMFPGSQEECQEFRETSEKILSEISKAHSDCLDDKDNESGNRGSCTKAACQELHTAKNDLQKRIREGYASCMKDAPEQNDAASRGMHDDELDEMQSSMLSGPAAVARRYVRIAVSDAISWAFDTKSGYIRNGINAAGISSHVWLKASEVRRECSGGGSNNDRIRECDDELMDTFKVLPNLVPAKYRYDPAVGVIQRAMMEKLDQVRGQVLNDLDNVSDDIDSSTTDSRNANKTSGSRRGRSRGIIEND